MVFGTLHSYPRLFPVVKQGTCKFPFSAGDSKFKLKKKWCPWLNKYINLVWDVMGGAQNDPKV